MNSCSYYLELLSQSLDQPLSPAEQADLQSHLDQCPDCRLLAQQLTQIHSELSVWEEQEVPEGFTQRVMDQIRALDTPKNIIPLWKRPQFKAVGSLAACAALCLGLWGSGLFSAGSTAMDGAAVLSASPTSETAQAPAPAAFQMTSASSTANTAVDDLSSAEPAAQESAVMDTAAQLPAAQAPMLKTERAATPQDEDLVALAAQAVGVTPGTLLLMDQLPQELAHYGAWFDAQGLRFFLFEILPSQSEQQALFETASRQIGQVDQPLIVLISG